MKKSAFTLIELLIVIAIIGILTVALLPQVLKAPAKARDAAKTKVVQDIKAGIEAYISKNNSYPAQSATGVVGTTETGLLELNSSIATTGPYYFCRPTLTPTFYEIGFRPEVVTNANSKAIEGNFVTDCNSQNAAFFTGTSSPNAMYVITN